MNKEQLQEYLKNKTETEIVHLIKCTAQSLLRARKSLDGRIKAEGELPLHSSRAVSTTACANTQKAHESYEGLKDMLKMLIKKI